MQVLVHIFVFYLTWGYGESMEAMVMYDLALEDLTLTKGDRVNVMSTKLDGGWYEAEYNAIPVMLPANYIHLKNHEWYVGTMGEEKAEQILKGQPDGTFLVRDSDSSLGDFEISVSYQGFVIHVKVLRDGSGKFFLWLIKFNSLNELLSYHRKASITRPPLEVFLKTEVTQLAIALYNFDAREDDEVSLEKGEKVYFTKSDNDYGWVKVRKADGAEGLAPWNYLEPVYEV